MKLLGQAEMMDHNVDAAARYWCIRGRGWFKRTENFHGGHDRRHIGTKMDRFRSLNQD
jgi:hypothetical protein